MIFSTIRLYIPILSVIPMKACIVDRFLRSSFRAILSRMKDVVMYYRKSNTTFRLSHNGSFDFRNPRVPFNPLKPYIPTRRNSYPDALLSDGRRKGGTGLREGVRTSAGNNSDKRRHIERVKESLPRKVHGVPYWP